MLATLAMEVHVMVSDLYVVFWNDLNIFTFMQTSMNVLHLPHVTAMLIVLTLWEVFCVGVTMDILVMDTTVQVYATYLIEVFTECQTSFSEHQEYKYLHNIVSRIKKMKHCVRV